MLQPKIKINTKYGIVWGYKCTVCKKFVSSDTCWYHKGKQKHYNCIKYKYNKIYI